MATAAHEIMVRRSAERFGAFAHDAFQVGISFCDISQDGDSYCVCGIRPTGADADCRAFSRTLATALEPRQRCPQGLHVIARPVVLPGGGTHLIASHGFLFESGAELEIPTDIPRHVIQEVPRLSPRQAGLLEEYLHLAADLMVSIARASQDQAREAVREDIWRAELGAPSLVGVSQAIVALREALPTLANSREPLFLDAEPGSGRHLIAIALHRLGPHSDRPFIVENLAKLPEALQEAEIFGHEDRPGLLADAQGGTIFLAGVERLTAVCQKRLSDFLNGGIAGSPKRKRRLPDIRILSSADMNLGEAVRKGRFRSDLSRKLSSLTLILAPLRERPEDIPILVEHLLHRRAATLQTATPSVEPEVLEALKKYSWPGNVRELDEVLARAAAGRGTVRFMDLGERVLRAAQPRKQDQIDLRQAVGELESELISRTLSDTDWNKSRSARILGLSRLGLQKKIDRYDLDRRR